MRKIYLFGELAEKVGHDMIEMEAPNLYNIVGGLRQYDRGIELLLNSNEWIIGIGTDVDDLMFLENPECVRMDLGDNDVWLIPKVGGDGPILAVGAAFAVPALAGAIGGGILGTLIASVIVSVVVSGISSMLAPTPPTPDQPETTSVDENPSFLFNGAPNVSEPGGAVPIALGQCKCGSVVIGTAVYTERT